jgi:hypothetical protein
MAVFKTGRDWLFQQFSKWLGNKENQFGVLDYVECNLNHQSK